MQFSRYLVGKNKTDITLNVIKITIIVFTSIYLIGNFVPYYVGIDSLVYGASAVNLANGSWGISNELLKETGLWEFVPHQWVKTVHNTAVPLSNPGIIGIAAVFYLVAGYYGLFYFGPIFTILLLIFSERIATKLFGKFIGLVTLILVSTSGIILIHGLWLYTDIIFSVFFILGCFYLIKFLQERRTGLIFLCSVFFTISTFIRLNGLIFLPLEIFLVVGYFAFQNYTQTKKELNSNNTFIVIKRTLSNIRIKKFFKITALMLIPWLVFFSFFFSYNSYYFGDPFKTYIAVQEEQTPEQESPKTFLKFDSETLAGTKFYLAPLLPGQPDTLWHVPIEEHDSHGVNWQSTLSFFILISALGISLYTKNKRTEVIIFFIFIAAMVYSYASVANSIDQRYMIPVIPLSFMLCGFILISIWNINFQISSIKWSKILSEGFIGGFLIIMIIFFIILFYYSWPIQDSMESGFFVRSPEDYAKRYPLDTEGLTENSVFIGLSLRKAVEYNVIPFDPFWNDDNARPFTASGIPLERNVDVEKRKYIPTLKKIIEEGYEVYAWKSKSRGETNYFESLKNEYGFVLKDHSKTFCKLELIKNVDEINIEKEADSVCYRIR